MNTNMYHRYHSTYFKRWAIIAEIVFLLSGIIAGFLFKTVDVSSKYYSLSETHFNWLLMLSVWSMSVVPVSILYGVYSHLENQEIQIDILREIYETQSLNTQNPAQSNIPNTAQPTQAKPPITPTVSSHNNWKCSKCGRINDANTIACKDCGTYK